MKTPILAPALVWAGATLSAHVPSETLAPAPETKPAAGEQPPALLSLSLSDDVTVNVGGRVNLDWTFATGDDAYDTDDGVQFRRARLHALGTIYDLVDYQVEFDFTGGSAGWRNVWFQVTGTGVGDVRVGHIKEPFSLEEQTSARYITFNERSLANVFSPGFNTGAMLSDTFGDNDVSWQVGVFRETDDFGNDNNTDADAERDSEWAFTGRLAGPLWNREEGQEVLHAGIALSHREPGDGMVRYRQRPEAGLLNRLADTGAINADNVQLGGAELAWVQGPLSLQTEYVASMVEGQDDDDDADFWGAYVEGSYFLTGEHRPYKTSGARFDRVKPLENHTRAGGRGAHQVALRWSTLDLDDGPGEGQMDGITLGYTWYLNPNTQIKANYVHSMVEDGDVDDEADIFVVRFQIDF